MRKQYHFRPSERGVLAWDVDCLVKLTKHLPRRHVSLNAIKELDEVYWSSHDGTRPTCRAVLGHAQLIEEVDLNFPIILSADGRVMDGMHRVAKAVLKGWEKIEAVQFETTPEPDYVDVDEDELPY